MYATTHPVTREFSRQHFAAAAARIEAAARSDAREYTYLRSGGIIPAENLDALEDSVTLRCLERDNLLHSLEVRDDII